MEKIKILNMKILRLSYNISIECKTKWVSIALKSFFHQSHLSKASLPLSRQFQNLSRGDPSPIDARPTVVRPLCALNQARTRTPGINRACGGTTTSNRAGDIERKRGNQTVEIVQDTYMHTTRAHARNWRWGEREKERAR